MKTSNKNDLQFLLYKCLSQMALFLDPIKKIVPLLAGWLAVALTELRPG